MQTWHTILFIFTFNVVVPDVAGTANTLSEEKISDKCFELMFAFDEVLNPSPLFNAWQTQNEINTL